MVWGGSLLGTQLTNHYLGCCYHALNQQQPLTKHLFADLAAPSSPLAEAADATSAAAVVPTQSATTAAEEGMPVLEAASDVAVATAAVPAGCTTKYTETDIRPIRVM